MNQVALVGRLSKDPDLKFVPTTGKAVARFNLAVSRPGKDKGADFINCVAFGKTAETIATYIAKGRQVAITGVIRTGSYDNKEGNKVYTTEIWVSGFTFVGNSNSASTPGQGFNDGGFGDGMTESYDGDIPY